MNAVLDRLNVATCGRWLHLEVQKISSDQKEKEDYHLYTELFNFLATVLTCI